MSFDLKKTVQSALKEDMPSGDITTDNLQISNLSGRARLVAKEDLVLSGSEIFSAVFHELDINIKINWQFQDSDFLLSGQTICTLEGPLASLLKGERVALNFMGRMSGIATLTKCFTDIVKDTRTKILDTRKTTPGLRYLEKLAVRHGGGLNHRFSLSDAVLIKENHIRAVGGIKEAISQIHSQTRGEIEVEVQNLEEVKTALACKAHRILLDNMSIAEMKEALQIIPSSIQTEASGNMNIEKVTAIRDLGLDFISIGQITHSAPTADLSLLFL